MPAITEPIRKTTIPPMKNGFRPYRSDSRPTIGTAVVDATRYAVVTQVNRSNPPRSATIRGIAVPTTVWSSAARKSASIRPPHREDDLPSRNRLEIYFRRRFRAGAHCPTVAMRQAASFLDRRLKVIRRPLRSDAKPLTPCSDDSPSDRGKRRMSIGQSEPTSCPVSLSVKGSQEPTGKQDSKMSLRSCDRAISFAKRTAGPKSQSWLTMMALRTAGRR